MTKNNWELTWRDQKMYADWSIPDPNVVKFVNNLDQNKIKRVLDLGFGLGRHLILLARKGFDTYGLEQTESGFSYCKNWLNTEKLKANIRKGDSKHMPFLDNFFDLVIAWNVIYHGNYSQLVVSLNEIKRVTRNKGLAYITINSTKNEYYGRGLEIERNTFLNPEKPDGEQLHHYSDLEEIYTLFSDWDILNIHEKEQSFSGKILPRSFHWEILVKK